LPEKRIKNMNDIERDARRYRRLQILGCVVMDTRRDAGLVSRFTNLDAIVDADLKAQPNRGEADPILDATARAAADTAKGALA
jgi:hypothetical protein